MSPHLPCMGTDPGSAHLKGQNQMSRPLQASKGSGSWSACGLLSVAVGSSFLIALVQLYGTPDIHRCCKSKVSQEHTHSNAGSRGRAVWWWWREAELPEEVLKEEWLPGGTPDLLKPWKWKQSACLVQKSSHNPVQLVLGCVAHWLECIVNRLL